MEGGCTYADPGERTRFGGSGPAVIVCTYLHFMRRAKEKVHAATENLIGYRTREFDGTNASFHEVFNCVSDLLSRTAFRRPLFI